MKRFEKSASPALSLLIFGGIAGTLFIDTQTRLGFTIWVLYLLPLGATILSYRPRLPYVVGVVCALLIGVGYLLSPPATTADVLSYAQVNRAIGAATMIGVGAIASHLVRTRVEAVLREWVNEGRARLRTALEGVDRVEKLRPAIAALVEHMGAVAGVVWGAEDDGSWRRVASTGAEGEDGARLAHDEGLVGRAASSSGPLVVADVPKGYLSVSSGLGAHDVVHLVLVPGDASGKTEVVVEVGSFRQVDLADRTLLASIGDPFASVVRLARERRHVEELLEETQRQAEELQTQQEELRVANEELEEQTRIAREAQATLESTNAELEQQQESLQEHNDALISAREQAKRRAEELAEASRYKSEFLANMSHELRTPLNSTLILAKLLADNKEGNLSAEQIKYAQTIYSAGNDLLALINDVLDLSKIEAGRVEVRRERVDLPAALAGLERAFRPLADEKGLRLSFTLDPSAPAAIESDGQRIDQILKNLLSNAIKFTDRGEVELRCEKKGDRVVIRVRDTGIGIPRELQEIIFDAFRQVDSGAARQYPGTGLGLTISRDLAGLLGGTLDVESAPGKGSTFALALPLVAAAREAKPAIVAEAPRPAPARSVDGAPARPRTNGGRRVLVVEDDDGFREVLEKHARAAGFEPVAARSADDAIRLATTSPPDAIVLDLGLPDHSGLTVLDRLKRDPATSHVPVHVVSGREEADATLGMGAIGVLKKPVAADELERAFRALEQRLTTRIKRVLVVEDDTRQREAIATLLGSDSVATTPASTSAEALELLSSQSFDCVVMDLVLPDASGFELLERLIERKVAFPPVIVYTGRALSHEEEARLRRYSKSIIIKGARSPERLLAEVTLFLHQVEAELPPERQRMLTRARSRDEAFEGKRILVAEDDVRNVFALSSILEPRGAKLVIARNGKQALDTLAREPVDLVLMDIMMPQMDGLEAMRNIRADPKLASLPIIALTAKAMQDDRDRCRDAGASDYIAKPIDVDKLLSLCRVWLGR